MCLAIPGKVESIFQEDELMPIAKVNFGGIRKEINLAYVPDAKIGDYVLVHVGFAISKIKEDEAQKIFKALEEIGGLDEISP